MKKPFLFIALFSILVSCQKENVEKPDNLIEKEKMIDIIYDLSVLQGIRSINQSELDSNHINPSTYVYKKYKVDSLQFAKSNQYYAAKDIKKYRALYDKVNERLLANKAIADTLIKKQEEKEKKEKLPKVEIKKPN